VTKGPYNPDTYRRQSIRLPKHDYSWTGAYFVTIRAAQHEPVFEIPELRKILEETWFALPERYPGTTLDEFIIMPDHVHGILRLDGTRDNAPKLGDVMRVFKSISTVTWLSYIKANNMSWPGHVWQRNYYERVIRDNLELEQNDNISVITPGGLQRKRLALIHK